MLERRESGVPKKELPRAAMLLAAAAIFLPPAVFAKLTRDTANRYEHQDLIADAEEARRLAVKPKVGGMQALREHSNWPVLADFPLDEVGTQAVIPGVSENHSRMELVDALTEPHQQAVFEITTLARDIHLTEEAPIPFRRVRAREVPNGTRFNEDILSRLGAHERADVVTTPIVVQGESSAMIIAKEIAVIALVNQINQANRRMLVYPQARPAAPFHERNFQLGSMAGPTARYATQFFGGQETLSFSNYDGVSYVHHPDTSIQEVSRDGQRVYQVTLSVQWTHDSGERFAGRHDHK